MHRLLRLMLALLFALAAGQALAAAKAAAPVEGVDYVVIEGGAPYRTVPGTVEVAEVFGYTCPHCAALEPKLATWKRTLSKDVRVVMVPAAFGGYWIPYARAYVAAQALGVADRSHAAMFEALHEEKSLPISRPSPEEIGAFYARYGVPVEKFVAAYGAPSVDAELARARAFIERSGVEGTPSLIVAGKYRVLGRSPDDALRIAAALVARERSRRPR